MKLLTVVIFFAILFQKEIDDRFIVWFEGRKLTIIDFKGIPEKGTDYSAQSFLDIKYKLTKVDTGYRVDIVSTFDQNKSWIIPEYSDSLTVGHEQKHFDICEIKSRQFRRKISNIAVFKNKSNLLITLFD